MATYVMSDLHGYFDKFVKMLNKIKFSKNDNLFILGDSIDRGPDGIKILEYIIDCPNIVLIKGNHEQLMLDALIEPTDEDQFKWFFNGGNTTCQKALELSQDRLVNILKYLLYCPNYVKININNKDYFLSHAGFPSPSRLFFNRIDTFLESNENYMDFLWNSKFESFLKTSFAKEYTFVFGHNPVALLEKECGIKVENKDKIFKYENKIDIDTNLSLNNEFSKLACLRLDDMEEFYV